MASTFTDLGIELMATGENAGTWGTKTNANLSLIEQLTGGVLSLSIAGGAGTQALTIADGALTGTAQQRVIEFTGTISGNRIITFPLLTENFYIIKNGTSGSHTVQLKAVSGSGATVTFSTTNKGYKLIYLDGVATNTGVFEAEIGDITGVTAGTNLTGGGTEGAVTINLADASTSTKGAASFSSDNFAASSGAITIKDSGVATAEIQNDAVTLAKMASGTDGNIISYDTSGNPVAVATGSSGQVLTSAGAGAVPSFQTLNAPSGAVTWSTTVKTSGFTASSGNGYFCNTTSAAFTVTLPSSPSAGDIVAVKDYANTWDTNNLTLGRNSQPIGGVAVDASLQTEGLAVTLVYIDSTKGWLVTDSGLQDEAPSPQFITATGGTITTSGDFKIHTFNSNATFCVSNAGNAAGSNTVDYMVVAGGAGGGSGTGPSSKRGAGGGGAGGFRESSGAASGCYTASPLGACVSALPVNAQGYPITVGAGGGGGNPAPGTDGGDSVFSNITSTGGGGGTSGPDDGPSKGGRDGGSGGGLGKPGPPGDQTAGAGNTPAFSPPQGNDGGGPRPAGDYLAGNGGGGATAAGSPLQGIPGDPNFNGGAGGAGATTSINASPTVFSEGGRGGIWNGPNPGSNNATANTGDAGRGGGAGNSYSGEAGGSGGSGRVVIRYKFQ